MRWLRKTSSLVIMTLGGLATALGVWADLPPTEQVADKVGAATSIGAALLPPIAIFGIFVFGSALLMWVVDRVRWYRRDGPRRELAVALWSLQFDEGNQAPGIPVGPAETFQLGRMNAKAEERHD